MSLPSQPLNTYTYTHGHTFQLPVDVVGVVDGIVVDFAGMFVVAVPVLEHESLL